MAKAKRKKAKASKKSKRRGAPRGPRTTLAELEMLAKNIGKR